MSELSHDMTIGASRTTPAIAPRATRPFAWSVRRELWENRATYLAPATVAGLILAASVLGTVRFAGHGAVLSDASPIQRLGLLELPYATAASAVAATMVIVAVFYALGALYNERRDRSILFWKSLPVSDVTVVLAKAAVPLVVMPITAFVVIELMEIIMFGLNSVGVLLRGSESAQSWSSLPFAQMQVVTLYSLVVTALWFAPLYAWMLFISSWAKRAPFLWAVLPPFALALVEKIAFGTGYVGGLISDRLTGFKHGFSDQAGQIAIISDPLLLLTPLGLISRVDFWMGMLTAAALLGAAVWCRRRREPI